MRCDAIRSSQDAMRWEPAPAPDQYMQLQSGHGAGGGPQQVGILQAGTQDAAPSSVPSAGIAARPPLWLRSEKRTR
jgi:hypothetical protein